MGSRKKMGTSLETQFSQNWPGLPILKQCLLDSWESGLSNGVRHASWHFETTFSWNNQGVRGFSSVLFFAAFVTCCSFLRGITFHFQIRFPPPGDDLLVQEVCTEEMSPFLHLTRVLYHVWPMVKAPAFSTHAHNDATWNERRMT